MSFSVQTLPLMPIGTGTDFDRSEDRDFHISGMVPAEIYYVEVDGVTTTGAINTPFTKLYGVYTYDLIAAEYANQALFALSSTDPAQVVAAGLPGDSNPHRYLVVVYGEKNPHDLTGI